MQSPSIYSILDAFLDHGYRMSLKTVMNLCQMTRQSCISLYLRNIIAFLKKCLIKTYQPSDVTLKLPEWSTKYLRELSNKYNKHPGYTADKRLGKNEHICSVISGLNYANAVNSDITNTILYPFLQQPIIELALSLPTYKLFNNEFSRFPMRTSIHQAYNTPHVWRKSKGESTGVILKSIEDNMDFIMSVCCEGFFAKNKLINKDDVISHIKTLASGEAFNIWPFIRLFSIEMFIYIWEDYQPDLSYFPLRAKSNISL